jgi:hypothetical protein
MATPLDQYASLTIAYTVPGEFADNPATGVPSAAATEIVAVCWVKQGSSRLLSEDANALSELPLTGYFLEPQRLPAAIRPGVSAPAILWRLDSGFNLTQGGRLRRWANHAAYNAFVEANRAKVDHEGQFTLALTPLSPYILPVQLLGAAIQGTFGVTSRWGDVV